MNLYGYGKPQTREAAKVRQKVKRDRRRRRERAKRATRRPPARYAD